MEFSPGWQDYFIIVTFTSLFLASGWLTLSILRGRESRIGDGLSRDGNEDNTAKQSSSEPLFGWSADLSILECILFVFINALAVTSLILLFTAQLGLFRLRYWLFLLVTYDLSLIIYLIRSTRHQFALRVTRLARFGVSDLLAVLICLLAIYNFNRPSESILNYRDPGAYVNIAIKISESGALRFRDADFDQFHSKERQELFLRLPLSEVPYQQVLQGFYLTDPISGELVPNFLHLYPLCLALAYKLWRFQGIFGVNALLGAVSCLILIQLGKRLFDSSVVGLAAGCLLALNMGQIWLARSPFSEILVQTMLLGAIWVLSVGMTEKSSGCFFLAGLLSGLTLLVRIDSLLVVLASLLFSLILVAYSKRRNVSFPVGSFLAGLLLTGGYACLHAVLFASPYLGNVLDVVSKTSGRWDSAIVIGATTLAVLAWRLWIGTSPLRGPAITYEKRDRMILVGVAAVMTTLFIYGYFVRPYQKPVIYQPPPGSLQPDSFRPYDEINLVRLGWYISPLGLGLAYLGSLISLRRLLEGKALILLHFILVLSLFSVFYLYKSRAMPDNYWVIRRYIEIVIPGSLLLASLGIVSISHWASRSALGSFSLVITGSIFMVLVGWQLGPSYLLLAQTEFSNSYNQVAALAGTVRDADILLLERGSFQDFLSGPLKMIFHRTSYCLASLSPSVDAFDRQMDQWVESGRRVYILAAEEQTALQSRRYRFVPKEIFQFNTGMVEQSLDRMPASLEELRFSIQIYEVQRAERQFNQNLISLNMGYHFGFNANGFHQTELSTDYEPFRWSGGHSFVELPELKAIDDAVLTLRLRQEIPAGLSHSTIEIFFNGKLLAEPLLSSAFQVLRFPVPKYLLDINGKNKIEFFSDTFSPGRLGGSNDIRELGFMVHCLKLQSLAPISSSNPLFFDFGAETDLVDGELAGFFGKEPGSYRWTQPDARVVLDPPIAGEGDLEISLRTIKSSPRHDFKQFITVSVDGKSIGKTELLDDWDGFRTYRFAIPRGGHTRAGTQIGITVTPPWIPMITDDYTDDWRILGCGVDWLKIGARE